MTKLVFSLALLTVALALGGCATLGARFAPRRSGACRPRGGATGGAGEASEEAR